MESITRSDRRSSEPTVRADGVETESTLKFPAVPGASLAQGALGLLKVGEAKRRDE